ncbi:MAG TPA: hypothetical protein VHO69_07645, partial [Phototrophicaceae bacterium]|nr:hypothetical protein [Phototrophicaceae bacterium]
PVRRETNGQLSLLTSEDDFLQHAHFHSWNWFRQAAAQWHRLKQATTQQDFFEQVNYRSKITTQDLAHPYKVLYTASGVHIAAVVIETNQMALNVYGRSVQGFVVDHKTYYYDAFSLDEAYYLCALLNAPCVDAAIKDYQSRGKGNVGQRDIHRTPFEACAIPPFVPTDADHLALARWSQAAHHAINDLKTMGGLSGKVVANRRQARAAVNDYLRQIDVVARRVLGLDES